MNILKPLHQQEQNRTSLKKSHIGNNFLNRRRRKTDSVMIILTERNVYLKEIRAKQVSAETLVDNKYAFLWKNLNKHVKNFFTVFPLNNRDRVFHLFNYFFAMLQWICPFIPLHIFFMISMFIVQWICGNLELRSLFYTQSASFNWSEVKLPNFMFFHQK